MPGPLVSRHRADFVCLRIAVIPLSVSVTLSLPYTSSMNLFQIITLWKEFQSEQTPCLANKRDGSRCRSSMLLETQETIKRLLIDLEAMDIDNSPRWEIQPVKLTNLAVCGYQRTSIRTKVNRLGQSQQEGRYADYRCPCDQRGYYQG
jgi:hypothetical protein